MSGSGLPPLSHGMMRTHVSPLIGKRQKESRYERDEEGKRLEETHTHMYTALPTIPFTLPPPSFFRLQHAALCFLAVTQLGVCL